MVAQKSIKELRTFGYTACIIFAILTAFLIWKNKFAWPFFGILLTIFLLLSIFAPQKLQPVEKWSLVFGEKVSLVISLIITFITFYFAVTPMALVIKLCGKDPLNRKFDKNAKTYWVPSDSKGSGSRYYTPY